MCTLFVDSNKNYLSQFSRNSNKKIFWMFDGQEQVEAYK